MAELLAPHRKNIREIYVSEFADMTEVDIPVEELERTRELLIETIHQDMTDDERYFLLSFKKRNPQWELLGLDNMEEVANLPSVQWKLLNLSKMDNKKHEQATEKLKSILFG